MVTRHSRATDSTITLICIKTLTRKNKKKQIRMTNQMLFIDGSVNPQTKVGYGSYLMLNELAKDEADKSNIVTRQFVNTTSTRLELQVLRYALERERTSRNELIVYTDSQNIIGLPKRRSTLESRAFKSQSGRALSNQDLYLDFYRLMDEFSFRLVKVQGHTKADKRNSVEQIFAMVDQACRNALRKNAYAE